MATSFTDIFYSCFQNVSGFFEEDLDPNFFIDLT